MDLPDAVKLRGDAVNTVVAFPLGKTAATRACAKVMASATLAPPVLRPGDAAPDFVLKDSHGKDTRLSAYSGRPIVLCFLKRDTNRLDNLALLRLRDHHGQLAAMGATVVGVSLGTVQTHADWRHKHEVPFHLLSDPEGRVHDLYDAWRTTLLGRRPAAVRRCTYLIDEDGIIRKVYWRMNVLTHAKALVTDVERLQAQRQWGKKDARPRDLLP